VKRVWIKFIVLCVLFTSFISVFSNNKINFVKGQQNIDYQEIHESILQEVNPGYREEWYGNKLDMLFIVPDGYESTVSNLSEWKTQKGVPSKIVNRSTYMQFSGRDEPEQLRNCIKYYYNEYGIQWVLLVGDTNLIPIRYVYNPDTRILREQGSNDVEAAQANDVYKPTDFYYSDLTGTWDSDGDGIYGEGTYENSIEEIDWIPEVHVGRLPGNNIPEIEKMVNKTLYYETAQNPGEWMNSMLLGAAIQDYPDSTDLDGEQEVWLANKIIEESVTGKINYTLLAESTQWGTNLSLNAFRDEINLGQSIVLFAGHGSPDSFNGESSTIFTTGTAESLNNYEMPSFFFADACSTNMYDYYPANNSMGEVLMKNERGGAIGYIGGMRLTYYYPNDTYGSCELCELNRGMTRLFFQEFFLNNYTQPGKALNEMRISYLNSVWLQDNPLGGRTYNIHNKEWERKNVLTYCLLGDPEIDIFTQNPKKFRNQTFGLMATYQEGSIIERLILDEYDNPVPNARITLIGENDGYNSYISDRSGVVTILLPNGTQEYTYTITAHNMIPRMGVLHVINDTNVPFFTGFPSYSPGKPTVNDKIQFIIPVNDSLYGSISCGIVVLSTDNFETYSLYELPYNTETLNVDGVLPQLKPETYSYILFAYDYAQNYAYISWTNTMIFKIPISVAFILILIANIGLVGFIGYFIFKSYQENRFRWKLE
jgi:hypothetical protein